MLLTSHSLNYKEQNGTSQQLSALDISTQKLTLNDEICLFSQM